MTPKQLDDPTEGLAIRLRDLRYLNAWLRRLG